MSAAAANMERMPDDVRRAMLLAVPEYGTVRQRGGRIFLDFSPEIRDGNRYLWTFFGKAFETREAAESVRQRICQDAARMPLVDAVAAFRGRRSRNHKATDVIWCLQRIGFELGTLKPRDESFVPAPPEEEK